MADYFFLGIVSFVINIVPILMPPTWVVLALAKINDPSFNPFLLALVGAIASSLGRAVLTFYSSFFRRFFNQKLKARASEIKNFFDRKRKAVFFGSFIFALGPIPSNLLFIASGLTKIKVKPLFAGFFLGRFVSYFFLIIISQSLFSAVEQYTGNASFLKLCFDAVGILAAFLFLFIDWKEIMHHAKTFSKSI